MNERFKPPDRLRDLLDPVGRQFGLEAAVDTGRVFARWSEIVGSEIAAHVEPTSLRGGVLRVRADSPAWATEIGYLAKDIVSRVNAAMGNSAVKELNVWSGPRSSESQKTAPSGRPQRASEREKSASRATPDDPREAFERARKVWASKHGKKGPDQGL